MGPYWGGPGGTDARPNRGDPINFAETGAVEAVMAATNRFGADCGVEAVGYQAHDSTGKEHPEMVLDNLLASVRSTGHIGVVGVYLPEDPGAATNGAKEGRIGFNYGLAFTKGISLMGGQCPVKKYNRELRDLIIRCHAPAPNIHAGS